MHVFLFFCVLSCYSIITSSDITLQDPIEVIKEKRPIEVIKKKRSLGEQQLKYWKEELAESRKQQLYFGKHLESSCKALTENKLLIGALKESLDLAQILSLYIQDPSIVENSIGKECYDLLCLARSIKKSSYQSGKHKMTVYAAGNLLFYDEGLSTKTYDELCNAAYNLRTAIYKNQFQNCLQLQETMKKLVDNEQFIINNLKTLREYIAATTLQINYLCLKEKHYQMDRELCGLKKGLEEVQEKIKKATALDIQTIKQQLSLPVREQKSYEQWTLADITKHTKPGVLDSVIFHDIQDWCYLIMHTIYNNIDGFGPLNQNMQVIAERQSFLDKKKLCQDDTLLMVYKLIKIHEALIRKDESIALYFKKGKFLNLMQTGQDLNNLWLDRIIKEHKDSTANLSVRREKQINLCFLIRSSLDKMLGVGSIFQYNDGSYAEKFMKVPFNCPKEYLQHNLGLFKSSLEDINKENSFLQDGITRQDMTKLLCRQFYADRICKIYQQLFPNVPKLEVVDCSYRCDSSDRMDAACCLAIKISEGCINPAMYLNSLPLNDEFKKYTLSDHKTMHLLSYELSAIIAKVFYSQFRRYKHY